MHKSVVAEPATRTAVNRTCLELFNPELTLSTPALQHMPIYIGQFPPRHRRPHKGGLAPLQARPATRDSPFPRETVTHFRLLPAT